MDTDYVAISHKQSPPRFLPDGQFFAKLVINGDNMMVNLFLDCDDYSDGYFCLQRGGFLIAQGRLGDSSVPIFTDACVDGDAVYHYDLSIHDYDGTVRARSQRIVVNTPKLSAIKKENTRDILIVDVIDDRTAAIRLNTPVFNGAGFDLYRNDVKVASGIVHHDKLCIDGGLWSGKDYSYYAVLRSENGCLIKTAKVNIKTFNRAAHPVNDLHQIMNDVIKKGVEHLIIDPIDMTLPNDGWDQFNSVVKDEKDCALGICLEESKQRWDNFVSACESLPKASVDTRYLGEDFYDPDNRP